MTTRELARKVGRYYRTPLGVANLALWAISVGLYLALAWLTGNHWFALVVQLVGSFAGGWMLSGIYTREPRERREKAYWER